MSVNKAEASQHAVDETGVLHQVSRGRNGWLRMYGLLYARKGLHRNVMDRLYTEANNNENTEKKQMPMGFMNEKGCSI